MADTQQTILYLEPEIAELLKQLVPSEDLRSKYVSDLIRAAAGVEDDPDSPDGSAGLLCALASQEVLASSWAGPEEDEAWRDLQFEM